MNIHIKKSRKSIDLRLSPYLIPLKDFLYYLTSTFCTLTLPSLRTERRMLIPF